MARCPFAEWRPLPENRTEPARVGTPAIIDHSIVGSAEGAYGYFLNSSDLESHFIVKLNGDIIQLIDTGRTADANYLANRYAISIETEDHGDPDRQPWTPAQLASLARLHAWIADVHEVPRRKCRTTSDAGLGYHTLFGAPSAWTPVAKSCPGRVRIQQWQDILLPAFVGGEVTIPEENVIVKLTKDDKGDAVEYWQLRANRVLAKDDQIKPDGDYGTNTAIAFAKALRAKAPMNTLTVARQERLQRIVESTVPAASVDVDVNRLAAQVAAKLRVNVSKPTAKVTVS